MKRSIILISALAVGVGVFGGLMVYRNHPAAGVENSAEAPQETESAAVSDTTPSLTPVSQGTTETIPARDGSTQPVAAVVASAEPPVNKESSALKNALQILVSPRADLKQKEATWKRLQNDGLLDDAIAELKARAAKSPMAAEYPAALGEAYIAKLKTTENYNERGMLALQADSSFDTALDLDPANWDAQFYKAASLAHWPAQFNKGPEVIERLSHLIDQQEKQPSEPHFAQTYALLGDEYAKIGKDDYAHEVWRLGALQFPGDATLQKKLSEAQSAARNGSAGN